MTRAFGGSRLRLTNLRALAALAAFGLGGCAAPPIIVASAGVSALQAGSTAYVRGELESADAVPLRAFHAAAMQAMDDLHFPIVDARVATRFAQIRGREIGGRAVRIDLEKKSPMVTKLNIRVGIFGDQAISRLIQQAISARLPEPGTAPPEPDEPPPPDPAARPEGFFYND
jgi:hypothetical protein